MSNAALFGGTGSAPLAVVGAQVELSVRMLDRDPFRDIQREADAAASRLSSILSLGIEGPIRTGAIARVASAIATLDDRIASLGGEGDAPQVLVDAVAKLRGLLKDLGISEVN